MQIQQDSENWCLAFSCRVKKHDDLNDKDGEGHEEDEHQPDINQLEIGRLGNGGCNALVECVDYQQDCQRQRD